jgi:hypothetical protein
LNTVITPPASSPEVADTEPLAGRTCPLHYRYPARIFARPPEVSCDVLYVVGGLYGNEPALDAVLDLYERERGPKRLVFNGDFHWFDVDPARFERVSQRVLEHLALRGNVETELAVAADESSDAGCGCAYPDWVNHAVVDRSNRIMSKLRQTAQHFPRLTQQMAALPMWRRVNVGESRVAIVHGDAESLAGWGFAQESLQQPQQLAQVQSWFVAAEVDVFACSHTCLPVFRDVPTPGRTLTPMVLNNGAAGMPNFYQAHHGLLTRIATHPFTGSERCFGLVRAGVHLDAIAIRYDHAAWSEQFLQQWPVGSDAHASYASRIAEGPAYQPADACQFKKD